jgi:hypothetical protein
LDKSTISDELSHTSLAGSTSKLLMGHTGVYIYRFHYSARFILKIISGEALWEYFTEDISLSASGRQAGCALRTGSSGILHTTNETKFS